MEFKPDTFENKENSCNICNKVFSRAAELKRHVIAVHEQLKQFVCEICEAEFTCRKYLRNHKKFVHENVESHKCDLCNKSYSRKSELVKHKMSFHEKLLRFECDQCDKKYPHRLSLKTHKMAIHENNKPFWHVIVEPCKKGCSAFAALQIGPSLQAASWEFLTFLLKFSNLLKFLE